MLYIVLHIIIVIDVDSRSCSENKLYIKYTYSYSRIRTFLHNFFYVLYICMSTLYSRKRQITMSISPEHKQQNKQ